jgi:hypothetical protein
MPRIDASKRVLYVPVADTSQNMIGLEWFRRIHGAEAL